MGKAEFFREEKAAAHKYIFEYVPNQYSVTDENLRSSDAVEIKIGQGTKPGMGGHLPGSKVTPEIAAVRDKTPGEDVISPSKFPGINTREDLKALVSELRKRSDGRPVGIKIAAGRIEERSGVLCLCGTRLYHHRRKRRRHRRFSGHRTGFHIGSDDLRSLQSSKVPGFHPFRYFSGDYRRAEGIF